MMQTVKFSNNKSSLNIYRAKSRTSNSLLILLVTLVIALVLIPIFYLVTRASQKSLAQIQNLLFRQKTFDVIVTTSLIVA